MYKGVEKYASKFPSTFLALFDCCMDDPTHLTQCGMDQEFINLFRASGLTTLSVVPPTKMMPAISLLCSARHTMNSRHHPVVMKWINSVKSYMLFADMIVIEDYSLRRRRKQTKSTSLDVND